MARAAIRKVGSPQTPADLRAYIVERLVGETGEPEAVLDAARSLAERAAPKIASALAEQLGAPLPGFAADGAALVRFASVAQAGVAQAGAAQADEPLAALLVLSSPASPDALAIGLDRLALGVAVGAFFGGDPALPPAPVGPEPSALEREVATLVLRECALALNGAGPRAFGFDASGATPLTGAALARASFRDGPAVRLRFRLGGEAGQPAAGVITATMPQRVLLGRGGGDAPPISPAAAQPDWAAHLSDEAMRSSVSLSAAMPLGRLTLGDIAALAPGQILPLIPEAGGQVRLSARGKTLFSGEFGRLGPRYTVRVSEPFDAARDLLASLVPPLNPSHDPEPLP